MGCAASQPQEQQQSKKKKRTKDKKESRATNDSGNGGKSNPLKAAPAAHPTRDVPASNTEPVSEAKATLVGREKYISDVGAVVMTVDAGTTTAALICFVPESGEGLAFSYRDVQGQIFIKEFVSDAQLEAEKTSAGVNLPWAAFFKSIASDVMKNKVKISATFSQVSISCNITSSKDPKHVQPFTVKLMPSGGGASDVSRLIIAPMTAMIQHKRRLTGDAKEKENRNSLTECRLVAAEGAILSARKGLSDRRPTVVALRANQAEMARSGFVVAAQTEIASRRLRSLTRTRNPNITATKALSTLDALYEDGGARFFSHLIVAPPHKPAPKNNEQSCLPGVFRQVFPLKDGENMVARLQQAPSTPQIKALFSSNKDDRVTAERTLLAMQKLDDWDYNVFAMEQATEGNALFYTIYAILYKLDLVSYFKLDDEILRNFLTALQAGYHPNPYHNATHAADVSHVNYFIMVTGGLIDKCSLSKEEILAGIIAGAIHDYDHPGFNNNFHTRTNAYLSTLYNDRSILENHHCACVYEMLRLPKYNVLSGMTDPQRVTIRDTMIEMVLSTDMGNHARIFGNFRRRQMDTGDGPWTAREDLRLALSISIKMADISNCGRPTHLYLEWAKNIANEFYNQGDAEAFSQLSPSPFMDRKKAAEDFPKGQVSFMKFIVIPMFEAIVEFLPKMDFCLQHCYDNRDYWKRREELQ